MFRFLLSLILTFSLLSQPTEYVHANESQAFSPTTITLFTSPTCPHCANAKAFLKDFQAENPGKITVVDYPLAENLDLAQQFYEQYRVPPQEQGLVPAIFIDNFYLFGFGEPTKQEISSYVLAQYAKGAIPQMKESRYVAGIDIAQFSLPIIALILGLADGFNVCSLGALVMILGLVMILRSRQKMFLLGGTFILTTGIIYAALIILWHRLFSLISPYIRSMEAFIGVLSILGGLYLLYEFIKAYKNGPVCSSNNLMTQIAPKIQKIFRSNSGILAMVGAVGLFATVVTIIEFPCSAFLPVIFAGVLVSADTPLILSALYMGIYMTMYLIDELIIFLIAVWTLRIKIVSPRWIIFFNLAAAITFLILGSYYMLGYR